MGAEQSTEGLDGSTVGLHVVSIDKSGPAFNAGLELFFDYITHINGERVTSPKQLDEQLDAVNRLIVYSSKTTQLRHVTVLAPEGKLGVGLRVCNFQIAHERVWRVLSVLEGSPASVAGLGPGDYVIGSNMGDLYDKGDFFTLCTEFIHKDLLLWVYSTKTDTIREIVIIPDPEWGGEGLLGCDMGYGHVHRIAAYLNNGSYNNLKQQTQNNEHHSNEPSHDHGDHHQDHSHSHDSNDHDHSHSQPSKEHSHDHNENHSHDHSDTNTGHNHSHENPNHDHSHDNTSDHHVDDNHSHEHTGPNTGHDHSHDDTNNDHSHHRSNHESQNEHTHDEDCKDHHHDHNSHNHSHDQLLSPELSEKDKLLNEPVKQTDKAKTARFEMHQSLKSK